jgi:hypothetical protein
MPYTALEFDHLIGQHAIRWIVLECASLGRACGGPVALPPRRDIAYFLEPRTAETDARGFADFKNRMTSATTTAADELVSKKVRERGEPHKHHAYEWDHSIFGAQISWACLEWSGSEEIAGPRTDVAYFVNRETAEADARAFSWLRDRRLEDKESRYNPSFSGSSC